MKNLVLTVLICLFAAPALALELALPVACTVGTDCWVQQYVDHDAGTGATDYACGVASYDGHDGTDIRTLNTSVAVDVLAAAAGTVRAVRDGVSDNLVKTDADKAAVDKMECGNGVVIDHAEGWQTQYCHMRKGSVAVKAGDAVVNGTKLGAIGYSGNAAFPHVHVTLRKDGKTVDPFSANSISDCRENDRSLWSASAQKALAYKGTEVLQLAWAPQIFEDAEIEAGNLSEFLPGKSSATVLFAEVINLYKDDMMTLTVQFPGEKPIVNSATMKRNRAAQRLHAGKKMKGKWPNGIYEGRLDVTRANRVVISKMITFALK